MIAAEPAVQPRGSRYNRSIMNPRNFRIQELGCKVNQWEGQLLREGFRALGLREAPKDSPADLYVINSCSVTASGGARSRNLLRRAVRENSSGHVLVTGCYAESDREVCVGIPGVTAAFGNQEKESIVPWVARRLLGMDGELPELPRGITDFAGHTRAFVKVQDGCRDNCSFCIIPSLRGEVTSRDEDEILEEVGALAAAGKREVVFTGIHMGYYGYDRQDEHAITRLCQRAAAVGGMNRIKLSSIEVHEITEELVNLFASNEVFVPHFHLPLQAGSDKTLRQMRRKYNTQRFRDAVALLRSKMPAPAITTDVIVGFPGETDDDFAESLAFCREMNFAKMHVFPYSVREGTDAALRTDKVHDAVIDHRRHAMGDLDMVMAQEWAQSFVGKTSLTLIEERTLGHGRLTGLTDRFVRVDLEGPDELMGQIVPVDITAAHEGKLQGKLAMANDVR